MKKILMSFVVVLVGLSAYAQNAPGVITQAATDVFTPKDFDDNDNAQVVLEGIFGSTCFHVAPAQYRIDLANRQIYIDNRITLTPGCVDALMYIPYTRVVELGQIPQGNYDVMVSDGRGNYTKRANLPIAKSKVSTFGTDEFLYAPIAEVSFQHGQTNGSFSLVLSGAFSNNCLSLAQVQVLAREGNVIELLPVSSMATDNCRLIAVPFSQTVSLPELPAGDVLIHVRGLGGQATNRVITVLDRFLPIPL